MKRILKASLAVLLVAVIAVQFVPVERDNPPPTREVRWDSPETRALAERACFDCHSNETRWPWYAHVAPVSWRLAGHVSDGRRHLNFSTWDRPNEDLDEVLEVLESGEMPLWDYVLIHRQARLSPEELATLTEGFKRTFTADPPIERRRGPRPPADGQSG